MKTLICEHCGKTFLTKKSDARFCSRDCYNNYIKIHGGSRKGRSQKVKVQCAECGKIEYVTPSRAKKYNCCSNECMGKFNSKRYNKQITLVCPICGKEYRCKQSKKEHHRTCGDKQCRGKWLSQTRQGENNSNYRKIEINLKKNAITGEIHDKSKNVYQHVVKTVLGLSSITKLPKGYVIHHKDANHMNNNPENLVVLPKTAHRLVHTYFGNVLIKALHTNKITREDFFKCCNDEERKFYENIIDLNVTHQAVLKQGELLEHPEVDNQQPSIYRNIIEGSTTNSRVLADNAEDSNTDTSALPDFIGDDIV
jgi:hypothetical protein